MATPEKTQLELIYKQFKLENLPIYQNHQLISIRKLFKILTIITLADLPPIEVMNFYLYCNFFKNRLLYSDTFKQNLTYINSKIKEVHQQITQHLDQYEKMLQETKSESDSEWIDSNIAILHDGAKILESIPNRCDYYDHKISTYLATKSETNNEKYIKSIETECAADFTKLAKLFANMCRIIGLE